VLHRLTGDASDAQLLAPRWSTHKNAIRELLAAELARRGTRQGALA
jgi:radical SAM superfamily enzyme